MEFLRQQFDKILLSALFLIGLGIFLHTLHHTSDGATVNWLENTIGQILAALLTLLVGRGIAQSGGGNTNVSVTETKPGA